MKRQTEREQMQRLGSVNSTAFVAQAPLFRFGGRGDEFAGFVHAHYTRECMVGSLTTYHYVYLVGKLHISKYNTGKSPANRQTPQSQQPASRPATPLCFSGKLCFFYVIAP